MTESGSDLYDRLHPKTGDRLLPRAETEEGRARLKLFARSPGLSAETRQHAQAELDEWSAKHPMTNDEGDPT